jgi:hypothetical protein
MAGKTEGSSKDVVTRPKVSAEGVREYLEFRPSTNALRKMRERQQKMFKIRLAEGESRRAEEKTMAAMLVPLGYGKTEAPPQGEVLDKKEQEVFLATLEASDIDKKQELRETVMGSIKAQEFFKLHYQKWVEQYKGDSKLQEKMTESEYVKQQGVLFIKQNRKLIIKKRTEDCFKQNATTEGLDAAQLEEKRDKLYKAVDLFIQANREKIISYSSLQPVKQKALLVKFGEVLAGEGFDKIEKSKIQEMFDLIAGDLEYEVLVLQDYEATYQVMIEMAGMDLSDEEWERRRQVALKKNAQGELQEYMQQQAQPKYGFPVAEGVSTGPSYARLSEVADAGGVHFAKAPGNLGKDVYAVEFSRFPMVKSFSPLLRIVYPKNSKNINDALFYIEDEFADKDSAKGEAIVKVPTRAYKVSEVPLAMNKLILDWCLNRGVNIRKPEQTEVGINDIVSDTQMTHMAERLFGFPLKEKPIMDEQFNMFMAFLKMLLRDDKKTSLSERVKGIMPILDNDGLVAYMRESLKTKGTTTKTLSALVEEARMRSEGNFRKPKKKGT